MNFHIRLWLCLARRSSADDFQYCRGIRESTGPWNSQMVGCVSDSEIITYRRGGPQRVITIAWQLDPAELDALSLPSTCYTNTRDSAFILHLLLIPSRCIVFSSPGFTLRKSKTSHGVPSSFEHIHTEHLPAPGKLRLPKMDPQPCKHPKS